MSDWNPDYEPVQYLTDGGDLDWHPPEMREFQAISNDAAELNRRAIAILDRDERIRALEATIRSAADRLRQSAHYSYSPDYCDPDVVATHEELCAALAGKTG